MRSYGAAVGTTRRTLGSSRCIWAARQRTRTTTLGCAASSLRRYLESGILDIWAAMSFLISQNTIANK